MVRHVLAFWLALSASPFVLGPSSFALHPVPRKCHERVVVVRLTPDAVLVDYHLEVDEWTVVFEDLPAVLSRVELGQLQERGSQAFYEAFVRGYGPILADKLIATLDDQELAFTCIKHSHVVKDSVQCDFVFQAPWKLLPGRNHAFTLREVAYDQEAARLQLSVTAESGVTILARTEPDESLKQRALLDLRPGDEDKLRMVAATLRMEGTPVAERLPPPRWETPVPTEAASSPQRLLDLLLDSRLGFWLLLGLASCFGAAHALTPGHGKTLVAAYLIGERGTIGHALLLGLVVTLTHTGAVLLVAALLPIFPRFYDVLSILGPLLVVCLGFWLLLRRLARQADHVHFGSPSHHHHHAAGIADHSHDERGQAHPVPSPTEPVSLGSLVVLGIGGGIVPCTDAIIMLGLAAATQRMWLALPLLLAFSLGLAAVLVALGVLVVKLKRFAGSRFAESRWFDALPIGSAVLVTLLGLWLCYDSLRSP